MAGTASIAGGQRSGGDASPGLGTGHPLFRRFLLPKGPAQGADTQSELRLPPPRPPSALRPLRGTAPGPAPGGRGHAEETNERARRGRTRPERQKLSRGAGGGGGKARRSPDLDLGEKAGGEETPATRTSVGGDGDRWRITPARSRIRGHCAEPRAPDLKARRRRHPPPVPVLRVPCSLSPPDLRGLTLAHILTDAPLKSHIPRNVIITPMPPGSVLGPTFDGYATRGKGQGL